MFELAYKPMAGLLQRMQQVGLSHTLFWDQSWVMVMIGFGTCKQMAIKTGARAMVFRYVNIHERGKD